MLRRCKTPVRGRASSPGWHCTLASSSFSRGCEPFEAQDFERGCSLHKGWSLIEFWRGGTPLLRLPLLYYPPQLCLIATITTALGKCHLHWSQPEPMWFSDSGKRWQIPAAAWRSTPCLMTVQQRRARRSLMLLLRGTNGFPQPPPAGSHASCVARNTLKTSSPTAKS